jgi:hypothetical protein
MPLNYCDKHNIILPILDGCFGRSTEVRGDFTTGRYLTYTGRPGTPFPSHQVRLMAERGCRASMVESLIPL